MSNTKTAEYIPFGDEWRKEIKKIPKDYIIDMVVKKSTEIEELKQEVKSLNRDKIRHLSESTSVIFKLKAELSSVKAKAEKLADALEAWQSFDSRIHNHVDCAKFHLKGMKALISFREGNNESTEVKKGI